MAELIDTLFTIEAGAFSFEAANPRHEQIPEIHPTIVWARFEALAEGARRATARLW